MQGIYRIRNILDDMRYVGSAQEFDSRWKVHRKELNKGTHWNSYLQNAWNKYGEENFAFEVEEEVENEGALFSIEQDYLDEGFELGILYNIARYAHGGHGSISPETKEKIREALLGYKHTQETKDNMSKARQKYFETHDAWNKGIPATKEQIRKNRESTLEWLETHDIWNKGKECPQLSGENNGMYGRTHTEETKQGLKESWYEIHKEMHPKPYPGFYNIKTNEYIPSGMNLKRLCEKKGLNYQNMLNLKREFVSRNRGGWRLATQEEIRAFNAVE